MDNEKDIEYDGLIFLPDNYQNSGRMLGGVLSVESMKELLIILGIAHVLSMVFLENAISSSWLWGLRIGFTLFVVSSHLLIKIAFNSSIIEFVTSVYDYFRMVKKYRYKRRDANYVRRQKD